MASDRNDFGLIIEFLSVARNDMSVIVNEYPRFIRTDLVEFVQAAWFEVNESIDVSIRQLQILWEERRDEIVSRFRMASLYGRLLDLKLQGYWRSQENFVRALQRGRPGRAAIRRFFAWMNVILGSLVSVVPD